MADTEAIATNGALVILAIAACICFVIAANRPEKVVPSPLPPMVALVEGDYPCVLHGVPIDRSEPSIVLELTKH